MALEAASGARPAVTTQKHSRGLGKAGLRFGSWGFASRRQLAPPRRSPALGGPGRRGEHGPGAVRSFQRARPGRGGGGAQFETHALLPARAVPVLPAARGTLPPHAAGTRATAHLAALRRELQPPLRDTHAAARGGSERDTTRPRSRAPEVPPPARPPWAPIGPSTF